MTLTPGHFIPEERTPCYPLDRGLNGPQSRSGHCSGENEKHAPIGNRIPIVPPVASHYINTELSRLVMF